jgi:hypothetical protein
MIQVHLNGWSMYAIQYQGFATMLQLAELKKTNPAAVGIEVGQSYEGVDDYGNDKFVDSGFVKALTSIIVLEPGMWVVGPDPTGRHLVFDNTQFEMLFEDEGAPKSGY